MAESDHLVTRQFFSEIWDSLGGDSAWKERVVFEGNSSMPAPFGATDLAAACFAATGAALGELLATTGTAPPAVRVSRPLASEWFQGSNEEPFGPSRPLVEPPRKERTQRPWMVEYPTADDRWLRLQGASATLRARIADALGVNEDPAEVGAVIRQHKAEEIEQVIVDGRGTVAANRTIEEWRSHPQGRAVAAEPLIDIHLGPSGKSPWRPTPGRPLAGIRVLDLTRVTAGPMATRFLAACGAEVLRLDAPDSDETSDGGTGRGDRVLGKRWAFLDLRTREGHDQFLNLLAGADVLVHGYRPGGLDDLVSPEERANAQPALVEVTLRAYGWTGPWAERRGFDTLVQFSSGIADEVSAWALEEPETRLPLHSLGYLVDASRPRHLPVEALDFGTGYEMAAAAIRGLTHRLTTGQGSVSRLSLARTAMLLVSGGRVPEEDQLLDFPLDGPFEDRIYVTGNGPMRRFEFPVKLENNPLFWERPWEAAGSSTPTWSTPRSN